MSLDIGDALRSGIDDLTSETGLLVGAVVFLYSLGALVANESLGAALLSRLFESGVYTAAQREAIQSFGRRTPFSLGAGVAVAPPPAGVAAPLRARGRVCAPWACAGPAGAAAPPRRAPTAAPRAGASSPSARPRCPPGRRGAAPRRRSPPALPVVSRGGAVASTARSR